MKISSALYCRCGNFLLQNQLFSKKLLIVGYQMRLLKSESHNQSKPRNHDKLLDPKLQTKPGYSIQNTEPNQVTRSKRRHQIV